MNPNEPWTLTARWVIPVAGPPLEHGTVTINGDRIVSVEPQGSRTADLDLGNTAVLPGLVNAHTHLDLSGLRGKCPPTEDFTKWLRAVIYHRRSRAAEDVEADIQSGVTESLVRGTTLTGDIASQGLSWDALVNRPLRAVVFHEILGLPYLQANKAMARVRDWFKTHLATATCRPGVSPHAPYSTHGSLFYRGNALARKYRAPLATHLAETRAELELIRHKRGPFVAFLSELGVWAPSGLEPHVVLRSTIGRDTPTLFIHCNYLPLHKFTPVNKQAAAVIYCPRTHAAFGHPPHPFRDFLARGIRVALGTDSLASNPDLDILAEARFVHQKHPDVAGSTLLRMATLSGAEALGWQDETGSLEPGKSADLVVLPLPNQDWEDPHRLVLDSTLAVQRVLFRGQWTQDELTQRR